jgi:hypothetical protein
MELKLLRLRFISWQDGPLRSREKIDLIFDV